VFEVDVIREAAVAAANGSERGDGGGGHRQTTATILYSIGCVAEVQPNQNSKLNT
jgi:hypothetical protein